MASKTLTPSRYIGKICVLHLDFNGLRVKPSGLCVQCSQERGVEARRQRKLLDPEYKTRINARGREWIKKNRPDIKRTSAKNRLLQRYTPSWADLAAIREFYRLCPEGMVVDHIIPLNGELVSGFHVENNLQLLTAIANTEKGNKYVP